MLAWTYTSLLLCFIPRSTGLPELYSSAYRFHNSYSDLLALKLCHYHHIVGSLFIIQHTPRQTFLPNLFSKSACMCFYSCLWFWPHHFFVIIISDWCKEKLTSFSGDSEAFLFFDWRRNSSSISKFSAISSLTVLSESVLLFLEIVPPSFWLWKYMAFWRF